MGGKEERRFFCFSKLETERGWSVLRLESVNTLCRHFQVGYMKEDINCHCLFEHNYGLGNPGKQYIYIFVDTYKANILNSHCELSQQSSSCSRASNSYV